MSIQPSDSLHIAILFGYNGSKFDGLERTKGSETIESHLLSAVASVSTQNLDSSVSISLLNISRSATTEQGEHATRQVLSLELGFSPDLIVPTPEAINALLPKDIQVFDVVAVLPGFSARRNCEARTFEFLIPTYVFSPPSSATHYAHPDLESDDEDVYPEPIDLPSGGLFTTMKRNLSIKRPAGPTQTSFKSSKKNKFGAFWKKLWFGSSDKNPQPQLKPTTVPLTASSSSTIPSLSRKKSLRRSQAPSIPLETPPNASSATVSGSPIHDEPDSFAGFISTLGRSLSMRRNPKREEMFHSTLTPAASEEGSERTKEPSTPESFEPLEIPWTQDYLDSLKNYRISPRQIETLKRILSTFNGTHNWHNYIPGASFSDPRCYLRILNIELSNPHVYNGMEWIRVKVQARAFARLQIRKMMALAIMIVRTNTPTPLIAHSFGASKIHVPECPSIGLVLDEPDYTEFNRYVKGMLNNVISFDSCYQAIAEFRAKKIHEGIYQLEEQEMHFAQWIRNMDAFSFMYTYFLNERGLIMKN